MKVKLVKAGRYLIGKLPIFENNQEVEITSENWNSIPEEDKSLFKIVEAEETSKEVRPSSKNKPAGK